MMMYHVLAIAFAIGAPPTQLMTLPIHLLHVMGASNVKGTAFSLEQVRWIIFDSNGMCARKATMAHVSHEHKCAEDDYDQKAGC